MRKGTNPAALTGHQGTVQVQYRRSRGTAHLSTRPAAVASAFAVDALSTCTHVKSDSSDETTLG